MGERDTQKRAEQTAFELKNHEAHTAPAAALAGVNAQRQRMAQELAWRASGGKSGVPPMARIMAERASAIPAAMRVMRKSQKAADGSVGGGDLAAKPALPVGPVAELEVCADTESVDRTKLSWEELQNAQVGHAFIKLRFYDPTKIPASIKSPTQGLLMQGASLMGFWPLVYRPQLFDPALAQQMGKRGVNARRRTESMRDIRPASARATISPMSGSRRILLTRMCLDASKSRTMPTRPKPRSSIR